MSATHTPLPRSPRLTRNAGLARYLNVSPMTIWRWQRDAELGFPPAAPINNIDFTDLNQVDDWLLTRRVDRTTQHEREVA